MLRDLAYPLIEPPHSRPAWKTVFGDYKPLPRHGGRSGIRPHHLWPPLIDEPHRSHSSRYAQLIEDVRDDISRFDPFFAAAGRCSFSTEAQRQPRAYLGTIAA